MADQKSFPALSSMSEVLRGERSMVDDSALAPLTSCVSTTLGCNAENLKNPFISGLLSSF